METLRLTDGRVLAFDDVGDPGGFPLVYQPGWMQGRLGRHPDDVLAAQAGLRLVSVDRPGYGGSTPQAVRSMRGSAEDTAQLADHLGIDRFALLGWSGGGLHALAAARYLGERVTHVVTVATPAPFDQRGATKWVHWLAVLPYRLRHVPPLRRAWFAFLASQAKDPSANIDAMMRFFGPEDRAVFTDPVFRPQLERGDAEVWAQGPTGADSDLAVMTQLDFRLSDVRQHVAVYHGQADTYVGPEAAAQLAGLLPDAEVHLVPGGHLCVFTLWSELLSAVAGRAQLSPG